MLSICQMRLYSHHATFLTNKIASFWYGLCEHFLHQNLHSVLKYSNFEYFCSHLMVHLPSISGHLIFTVLFQTSLRSSEARCEVQKFISEFASGFVNKGLDWPLNSKKPIKCLVQFTNQLTNSEMGF